MQKQRGGERLRGHLAGGWVRPAWPPFASHSLSLLEAPLTDGGLAPPRSSQCPTRVLLMGRAWLAARAVCDVCPGPPSSFPPVPTVTAVLKMVGGAGGGSSPAAETGWMLPGHPVTCRMASIALAAFQGKGRWEEPGVKGDRERGKHNHWPEIRELPKRKIMYQLQV